MTMFFDEEIDRVFKRMSSPFLTGGILDGLGKTADGPICYGYTITVGPDGVPVIREYGNARPAPGESDTREPIVDVIADEKENSIKLVAEMPGVEKEDVKLTVLDRAVDISAARGDKEYRARVPIRHKIDGDSASASYRNGILELTFKLAEKKPRGKTVEVN